MVAHTHHVTACRDGCQTLQLTRSLVSGPGSSLMCPAHGTASGLGIRPHMLLYSFRVSYKSVYRIFLCVGLRATCKDNKHAKKPGLHHLLNTI